MRGRREESTALADNACFNFSRAVREWCFVQRRLIELSKLHEAAKDRGLSDLGLFSRDPWETLDREEIFVPVAYALHGLWEQDQSGCLEDGDLMIREEVGYRPWSDLLDEADRRHGERGTPQILYHHWQLFWLADLQARLTPHVPWGNLGDGLDTFFDARAKLCAPPDPPPGDALRAAAHGYRHTELLLTRVQNVFYPINASDPRRSSWRSGPVPGLTDDAYEWTVSQLYETDFVAVADECGIDVDGLKQLYEQLVYKGLRLDPTEHLLHLMDQLRRTRREGLRGPARLALDYYDAARVIRSWHERITGQKLPEIDEYLGINGTQFKQHHFGTLDTRGNCAVIPTLLEDFGLYPWRVQLIGEGESELAALRLLVKEAYGMSFEELGIAVMDMGGADIPENAERLLRDLRIYANYFLLVFDNEGTARAVIDELRRGSVIEGVSDKQRAAVLAEAAKAIKQLDDADARKAALKAAQDRARCLDEEPGAAPEFVLWRENFEADNFAISEMCAVVEQHARENCALDDFSLDEGEIEAAAEAQQTTGGQVPALASVILEAARSKDAGFVLSKPDFARQLARYALRNPEFNGERRKLLDLAEHLVRLTWASRRLAGALRRR